MTVGNTPRDQQGTPQPEAAGAAPAQAVQAAQEFLSRIYRRAHAGTAAGAASAASSARSHLAVGHIREPGQSNVRLIPLRAASTPATGRPAAGERESGSGGDTAAGASGETTAGGGSGGAVLQVVTDDAPLLVESLTALLGSAGFAVDHLVHPVLLVRRGPDGTLTGLDGEAARHTPDREAGGDAAPAGGEAARESWIYLEVAGIPEQQLPDVETRVRRLLGDIGWVRGDTRAMREQMIRVADGLDGGEGAGSGSQAQASECAALLRWMEDGNVSLLGYRRYAAADPGGEGDSAGGRGNSSQVAELTAVQGAGLGVFHSDGPAGRTLAVGEPDIAESIPLFTMTQGQSSTVALHVLHPFYAGVRIFDADGTLAGEHRFLGVFTMSAIHQSVFDIPLLKRRARTVVEQSGYDPDSFNGQSVVEIIESYPRTEMFATSTAALLRLVDEVLDLGVRRGVRLFLRGDRNGRFVSALVYLPRDRYTTRTRGRIREVLLDELGGVDADYSARVTESALAMIHFTVQTPAAWESGDGPDLNPGRVLRIQQRLAERTRSWEDALVHEAGGSDGAGQDGAGQDGAGVADGPGIEEIDRRTLRRYAARFGEAYKEDFTAADAKADIAVLRSLEPGALQVRWRRDPRRRTGQWRLMMYLAGPGVSLTQIVPVLQSLGVDVIFERPYSVVRPDGEQCWIYSFGTVLVDDLKHRRDITPDSIAGRRFLAAFDAVWNRRAETDRFNELVMRAGIDWREAAVLRAYGKYLRQAGFAYSQNHIQNVLCANPEVVGSLSALFRARFTPDGGSADTGSASGGGSASGDDPMRGGGSAPEGDAAWPPASAADRQRRIAVLSEEIAAELDSIVSIDTDRVLRAYLHLVTGTVRTNFYATGDGGAAREQLSFKFESRRIPELPEPRPMYEIFVYSPRIEGVHLRYGAVARGGLRWSDRREDFRTEVLGLVKAQAVKNAVIVPLGAKGGFVVKRPPSPSATGDAAKDREAHLAEGIACYKAFIAGLLDVTDNLDTATGAVLPPAGVVRHDGDDTYLVVAADKGTASFSDIANSVSDDYGYWLSDAFASGGSSGYDHKEMGITARGAWESVRRHFRELGVDPQTDDITVVGVGDMSGDVFGNGMLCSEHIRLVAAFDHRHIFIDPNPDAKSGYAERKRLYELPRSTWADYDRSLISQGGGVWERSAKSIPVAPQVREALSMGADVAELSAPELVRAVLRAHVDLLWNGGIGTYVKASSESDADAGDKANDAVRINGADLRVRVVGEGGNLGVTQRGRIEFARAGGRINSDAVDNSAGVDSSDREVNIKILLQRAIAADNLERGERDALLASMTDDVAAMVLADNVSQNRVLGVDRQQTVQMLRVHERLIEWLEEHAGMDRAIECLPDDDEFDRRAEAREGLTSPELAVLLAHVKLAMKSELLAGKLLDSTVVADRLPGYFPPALRERFADDIAGHPLRREIIATVVVNEVVDRAGITYAFRLGELAGAGIEDSVRAFLALTEIYGLRDLWGRIDAAEIDADSADTLVLVTRRLVDRSARWLLANRPQPLAVAAEIRRFSRIVGALVPVVEDVIAGQARDRLDRRTAQLAERGVDRRLAHDVSIQLDLFALLDVCTIAEVSERDPDEVARVYFALSAHMRMDDFQVAVSELARGDRWHSLARLTLREDLYGAIRQLTTDVLRSAEPDEDVSSMIAEWEERGGSRIDRARVMLAEIADSGDKDLATLSVAARQFRSMVTVSTVRAEKPR